MHPLVVTLRLQTPPEATAGTGGVYPLGVAPFAGHITRAEIMPAAVVTGVATNYKKAAIQNRGANGSGTTEMASLAFTAGTNAPQADNTPLALNGTPANLDFAAGDVIALVTTVNGTGMVLPSLTPEVDLYRD
jgi:hypothetical protein